MKSLATAITIVLVSTLMFAQRPTSFSGTFIGEKMWDTRKMVPYSGKVSLKICDSIAILKYHSTAREDTFMYRDIHNDGYRYGRKKHPGLLWEFLNLSKDSLRLQVGEPKEQNYFYKLASIDNSVICINCRGTGKVLCPYCQGVGHVFPWQNDRDAAESPRVCPYCNGSKSITHSPCRRCKGAGVVIIKKHYR